MITPPGPGRRPVLLLCAGAPREPEHVFANDSHIAVLEGDAEGQDIRIAIDDVVRYGARDYFNCERGTGGVQDILSAVHPTECASAQVLRYAITAIQDR